MVPASSSKGGRILNLTGTAYDVALIRSIMLYPESPSNRASYLQWYPLLLRPHSPAEHLDLGPSVADENLKELARHATVAGAILGSYYMLDRMKDGGGIFAKPSMDKAIHLARKFAQQTVTFVDNSVIHTSKRTINKYWKEFRSVSPLWAALWINDVGVQYRYMGQDAQFDNAGNIELFLGVATVLRDFAMTTIDIQGNALLDAESAWLFPKGTLAKPYPKAAPGDSHIVQVMRTYRPRKTEYICS